MNIKIAPLNANDPPIDLPSKGNRVTIQIYSGRAGLGLRVRVDHGNGFEDLVTPNEDYILVVEDEDASQN